MTDDLDLPQFAGDRPKTETPASEAVASGKTEPVTPAGPSQRNLVWGIILICLLLADLLGMLAWGIIRPGDRVAKQEVTVYIPPNNNTRQIALILKDSGIINSAWSFRVIAKVLSWDRQLKSGMYIFEPGSNLLAALHKVRRGQQLLVNVLVPEGFTIRQTARRLNELLGIDETSFQEGLARIDWDQLREKYPFLKTLLQNTFEGFLFPDTYRISYGDAQPAVMADLMLKRFNEVVMPIYNSRPQRYSLRQVVTLASLVEKEAQRADERPIIAAVFLKRMNKGMFLQSCATVNYVLPEPKDILTYADLKIQSPYNTYINRGLPPTPICSPGLAAIKAVLEPASTPYLYFVSKGDGSHAFSETYAQHLAAQKEILSGLYQSKQKPALPIAIPTQ